MSENEILKQIDLLISETEENLTYCIADIDICETYSIFFSNVKAHMQNYEKVLEVNHFKQTEL